MNSWWQGWQDFFTFVGIGCSFGVIKAHFKGQLSHWQQWMVSVSVSISVSVIIGYATEAMDFEQGIVFAFVAASAIIAENLVAVMMGVGDALQRDPVGFVRMIRGRRD